MLAAATIFAACGGPGADGESPAPAPAVEPAGFPAAVGSGEPNLSAADGRVWLSWIEPDGEGHALRFAAREGAAWSSPRTITRGDDWFVNWADFPSIVELPDGTLAAHWLQKTGEDTYAYGVRVARSADGGATWSEPVVPHTDGTETEHGFVTLLPWTDGSLALVWLDGRKYADAAPGESGAEMTLRTARLEGDGLAGEALLDDRACDCCQTDAARAEDGPVVVYRDRSPEEVRDISIVRWTGSEWTDPAPVHDDGWVIEACPVNGPAVAARADTLAVAWFTAAEDTMRVDLARSVDGGATFGAPVRVDAGTPEGRVDLALLDGGDALVLWLERADGGAGRLLLRRVAPDGRLGEPVTVAETSYARSSGFPRMAVSGEEVVFAWTDPADPPRVRTAVAPLSSIPVD